MHDMLVVGVVLTVSLTQIDQLLEAGQTTVRLALSRRLLDRFRQIEELDQIARNIDRIGHDPANILAQDLFQFSFPFAQEGLSRRNHHLAGRHPYRQDAETCRIGTGHHITHTAEIDFQRVDVEIVESAAPRQPLGQHLNCQQAIAVPQLRFSQSNQGVLLAALHTVFSLTGRGSRRRYPAIFLQESQDFAETEAMLLWLVRGGLIRHARTIAPASGSAA